METREPQDDKQYGDPCIADNEGELLGALAEDTKSNSRSFPLSHQQERLWYFDQFQPGNPSCHLAQSVRLSGRLDVERLQESLNQVLQRHEVLRVTFSVQDGQPVQTVQADCFIDIRIEDLQDVPEAERATTLRHLTEQEFQQPFDLSRGPLIRAKLFRLGEDEHILIITEHHIVFDMWSMALLLRETAILYGGGEPQNDKLLSDSKHQYADFVQWQREHLQSGKLRHDLAYWRGKLNGTPVLSLPTDRPRPDTASGKFGQVAFELDQELTETIEELSFQEDATAFVVLLAAFKLLLAMLSGQEDICVGSPVAGRKPAWTATLIGNFPNPLALRSDLSGNPSFRTLLGRVRTTVLDAFAHKQMPFSQVASLARRSGNQQLFNVMFTLLKGAGLSDQLYTEELTLAPVDLGVWLAPTDMDLFLSIFERADGLPLYAMLGYSTDLFDKDTIDLVVSSFTKVLKACLSDPDAPVSALELSEPLPVKVGKARERDRYATMAITATFAADLIERTLNFWLPELKLKYKPAFAPYNQVFQQLLDPKSLLSTNAGGINVALVRLEDWQSFQHQRCSPVALANDNWTAIERNLEDLIAALKAAAARSKAPYLLCFCPPSDSVVADRTLFSFLAELERNAASELKGTSGIYVVTSAELARTYPVTLYNDSHTDALAHVPYTQAFYTAIGTMIARRAYSILQAPRKAIVLDCDNTLWTGVCAEDGPLGIELDETRTALQEFMVAQHDAGMLICLCSKNNEEDVTQVFAQRPEMPLKRHHITSWRLNWHSKSENLRALAAELGLGLDGFIFVDDNPVECAEVEANCPQALTVLLPQEATKIPKFLRQIWAFDHLAITEEDARRTELYQLNLERQKCLSDSVSLNEFLAGLDLRIDISPIESGQLARVSQLTQRTNQFNLTGRKRSELELQELLRKDGTECHVVHVRDRFGDYGLVGLMIFTVDVNTLSVDSLLLSCRSLGRGVEHRMLAHLGEIAHARGIPYVDLSFVPTQRNQPGLGFLESVVDGSRQPTESDLCFRLQAKYAAAVRYQPGLKAAKTANHSSGADPYGLQAALTQTAHDTSKLLNRIANELNDPIKLLELIDSRDRPQPRLVIHDHSARVRTPTESRLSELCSQILRLDHVGAHDNFFDLGGTSFQIAQLSSRVKELFHVQLDLHLFLEQPTVAHLAQAIDSAAALDSAAGEKRLMNTAPRLDLRAEAALPLEIRPESSPSVSAVRPSRILLTGATGFLGAFILHELLAQTSADVHCLVRSDTPLDGKERIKKNLQAYELWQEDLSPRVLPVAGDLSKPLLGLTPRQFEVLASKVDSIYHSGAVVDFIRPYQMLKASNVLGTQEILRLACQDGATPVHFVSTTAVFTSESYAGRTEILEHESLPADDQPGDGYAQSKWVAEALVAGARSRGLPITIFRPGVIAGDSRSGAWNTEDFLCRMLKGCIQLGSAPIIDTSIDLAPVDFVSKAIVHLSLRADWQGKAFHLVNPTAVRPLELLEWLTAFGYPLRMVSYERWKSELLSLGSRCCDNVLYPLAPLFSSGLFDEQMQIRARLPRVDNANTLSGLKNTDMVCPRIDARLFSTYLSYFVRSGFLGPVMVRR